MLKLWDRKSDINGVPADRYLGNHPEISSGKETVLSYNDITSKVEEVFNVETIKGMLGITEEMEPVTVIEKFMTKRKEENDKAQQEHQAEAALAKEYGQRIAEIEYELLLNVSK